jgi:hypothetical protein
MSEDFDRLKAQKDAILAKQRSKGDEALEILEAIIYASDGCRGHAGCNHSMEPWRRARALLFPAGPTEAE